MRLTKRLIYLISITVSVLVLDQWSKLAAIEYLKGHPPIFYWGGILQLRYAENRGAWGSMGANWDPVLRNSLLIILPLLVLAFLAYQVFREKDIDRIKITAYSCIFAGGMGNVIDRIRFDYVVDFMYVGYRYLQTNIFNIADMTIMTGFGLVVIISILELIRNKQPKES